MGVGVSKRTDSLWGFSSSFVIFTTNIDTTVVLMSYPWVTVGQRQSLRDASSDTRTCSVSLKVPESKEHTLLSLSPLESLVKIVTLRNCDVPTLMTISRCLKNELSLSLPSTTLWSPLF